MNNPTDTNQASEDELNKILNWHSNCREEIKTKAPGYADPKYAEMQYQTIVTHHRNEAKAAIQALIRNEKLKLLAEVRERVVGEDLPLPEEIMAQTGTRLYNKIKSEERETLDKLEAEL